MVSIYFVVFILGSLWGSFCNVCIYRLPVKGDVVSSRSRCRSCKKIIRWFDNIPLVSYIILLAKCRNCKSKINFRYFAVELSTALSFLAVFYLYGVTISTLLLMVLIIFFVIIFLMAEKKKSSKMWCLFLFFSSFLLTIYQDLRRLRW